MVAHAGVNYIVMLLVCTLVPQNLSSFLLHLHKRVGASVNPAFLAKVQIIVSSFYNLFSPPLSQPFQLSACLLDGSNAKSFASLLILDDLKFTCVGKVKTVIHILTSLFIVKSLKDIFHQLGLENNFVVLHLKKKQFVSRTHSKISVQVSRVKIDETVHI